MFEKLARPPEEVRAENLWVWASSLEGIVPIREIKLRQRCVVAGVIQNIRIDPREGSGSIEATITDGTGEVVAKWLGRPSLSGVRLGMGLVVEGTPGATAAGEVAILNPEYRLVPGPEHG
jgi:RecG wedge domain